MKQYHCFFGVDVSKKALDITLLRDATLSHRQFENDADGMEDLLRWLQALNVNFEQALFCMEATGLYCFVLTEFLTTHAIDTWVEHAAQIKKSGVLERGKTDRVDSKRIALYAAKNLDRLRLWQPSSLTLQKIKHLASLRERLVETKKRLTVPLKEFEDAGNPQMAKLLSSSIRSTLTALDKDLSKLEAKIITIVNDDEHLKSLFAILSSVVGIGFVTAINLIVHTSGFTQLRDARKLACYCGVAPFEYSSGTSIRGKTKVHFMANKKLKCNLHMASLTAVKLDADLKAYYERKVGEGKNKMSVLNAVKCKLLARVVSVVNNNREYVKNKAS
jgi:transposase